MNAPEQLDLFRLPPVEPVIFNVDLASQSVREVDQASGALGGTTIKAMPICDVEMPHLSHISDEEEFRFQLPVMIVGIASRAVFEERLLQRDLPGYADYAARVRFRLLPGVW